MNATETNDTQQSVTFHSPTNELRLVKEPTRRKQVGEGGDFINIPGETVTFSEGRLVASDPELLDWLREHDEYGRLFHEAGAEPDRPREDSSALLSHVVELAVDGKSDEIADILLAERSSYSRPEVISACETALNRAGSDVPAKPATPEHELMRVHMPPAGQPYAEGLEPGQPTDQGTPTAVLSGAELPPSQTGQTAPTDEGGVPQFDENEPQPGAPVAEEGVEAPVGDQEAPISGEGDKPAEETPAE